EGEDGAVLRQDRAEQEVDPLARGVDQGLEPLGEGRQGGLAGLPVEDHHGEDDLSEQGPDDRARFDRAAVGREGERDGEDDRHPADAPEHVGHVHAPSLLVIDYRDLAHSRCVTTFVKPECDSQIIVSQLVNPFLQGETGARRGCSPSRKTVSETPLGSGVRGGMWCRSPSSRSPNGPGCPSRPPPGRSPGAGASARPIARRCCAPPMSSTTSRTRSPRRCAAAPPAPSAWWCRSSPTRSSPPWSRRSSGRPSWASAACCWPPRTTTPRPRPAGCAPCSTGRSTRSS